MLREWFAHIVLPRWAEPALSHTNGRVSDIDAPEIPEGEDVFAGMSQVSTSTSPAPLPPPLPPPLPAARPGDDL